MKRVMDGGVLPFVGAGISRAARAPGHDLEPTVDWMANALRSRICAALQHAPDGPAEQLLAPIASGTPANALARWAEFGTLLWGPREVCEILQIDGFADLDPEPAHRYLAYLAREGLVTEIVSTNYDCCLETAFRRSFGEDVANAHTTVAVIRNLEEYRRHAGCRHAMGTDGMRRPVLHLFKINGCAEAYRQAKLTAQSFATVEHERAWQAAADRIILTERQLQNFRNERWAEDLLRDRARRRNLLFCGFGSEEPQVRHAVLALMGEFQTDHAGGIGLTPQQAAALPNAPFVAIYSIPSFYQFQIVSAFVHVHCGPVGRGIGPDQVAEPLLHNVLSGSDAAQLGAIDGGLDAGAFFRALFEDVYWHLLEQTLDEGAALHLWLRELTPMASSWADGLREPPQGETEGARVSSDWMRRFLEPGPSGGPLRLWRWLWAMRELARAETPPADWYLPLSEEPLLPSLTLVLLRALGGPHACVHEPRPEAGLGLGVDASCAANGQSRRVRVYLVVDGVEVPREGPDCGRLVRHVAVPAARTLALRSRWVRFWTDSAGVRHLRIGRREVVPASDLVRAAVRPDRLAAVLCNAFAAARRRPAARLRVVQCRRNGP